ncbi:MAG: transglycosylase domain-containing protein [Paenibacillaceae bacterium]|nr:transglycosylase domain-containing protein [Paenibacillaceae bacterium]
MRTPTDDQKPKRARRKRRHFVFGAMRVVAYTVFLCTMFCVAIATGYFASLVRDDAVRPRALIRDMMGQSAQSGYVYFRSGEPIGQLRTEEDRVLITYNDIPPLLEAAVLATEDNEFYDHIGVDASSLARAVRQKLLNEDVQTGGSTITQQLARRVFLSLEKSAERKGKEILLALRIERYMTKQEILAAYLNKIPYGNSASGYNVYGIKAAARGLFDKNLPDLHIAQIAYLTGLPQQPTTFSAFTSKGEFDEKGFDAAIKRQRVVLQRMRAAGRITPAQYDDALAFDVRASLAAPRRKGYAVYPFLMLEAERRAAELLLLQQDPSLTPEALRDPSVAPRIEEARALLLRGGYHITTTIDAAAYRLMGDIARTDTLFSPPHPRKGVEQIGAMLLDNRSGAIVSMIEGRDFGIEQLNHATQMLRQPGSAMKPIAAYWPALEDGSIQPASIIDDVPMVLPDANKGVHIPQNWDRKFHGLVTARKALNQSWNIPALHIFNDVVTIPKAWAFSRSLGITSLSPRDNQARTGVIGGLTLGVSVEELTNAYAAIANAGSFVDAHLISKIVDASGKTIVEHRVSPRRVASPQASYLMHDMLRTVVTEGTAAEVAREFRHKNTVAIAGKTGTTSDNYDIWFVGYTPDVTLGVWIGYDRPSSLPVASRAKKIWVAIMNTLVSQQKSLFPTQQFAQPADIVRKTVSSLSGKLPSELILAQGLTVTDVFERKYIPTTLDNVLRIEKVVDAAGSTYLAQPNMPQEFARDMRIIKRARPIDDVLADVEQAWTASPANKNVPFPKQRFVPLDAVLNAPTQIDPRTDDGTAPSPPSNVQIQRKGETTVVSFAPNRESDVVGYRLFRARNNGDFVPFPNVTTQTAAPSFVDRTTNTAASYYVVAVDIAGRTSPPSTTVTLVGTRIPDIAPLPENPLGPRIPQAPSGLRISPSEFGVELMWQPNPAEDAVERYDIYVTRDGSETLIGSTFESAFLFTNSDVSGSYTVRAINAQGESDPSQSVSANTPL